MNSILALIIGAIDINLSDFMLRPFYYGLNPYTNIMGDSFIAGLVLLIGAGIYLGTDKNTFIVAIYLMAASALIGVVFPFQISAFIVIVAAIIMAVMLYRQFAVKRTVR